MYKTLINLHRELEADKNRNRKFCKRYAWVFSLLKPFNIEYLGSGWAAIVFSHPFNPNKVIRITQDHPKLIPPRFKKWFIVERYKIIDLYFFHIEINEKLKPLPENFNIINFKTRFSQFLSGYNDKLRHNDFTYFLEAIEGDISPRNLGWDSNNRIKILDTGIIKTFSNKNGLSNRRIYVEEERLFYRVRRRREQDIDSGGKLVKDSLPIGRLIGRIIIFLLMDLLNYENPRVSKTSL
jgi:hypothetical protein